MTFEYKTDNALFRYKTSKKEKCFEYFVISICKSYVNDGNKIENNDFGILKIMKLLFFTVAASYTIEKNGLLEIFNNWEAQPYGHVENDIYDIIRYRKGIFNLFTITGNNLTLNNPL